MRTLRLRLANMAFLLLPVIAVARPARAQESQVEGAAAQMAEALSHSKQKTVIVFDFAGPDNTVTALGQELADEFSNSLSKSSHNLHVENRSRIGELIAKENLTPDAIHDSDMYPVIAWDLNIKIAAYISGTLLLKENDLKVVIEATQIKDSKKTASLEFAIPLTNETKGLLARVVANVPSSAYPTSGKNGYSSPHCTYCPSAKYPYGALQKTYQGTVILQAVVDVNGVLRDIRVAKPLPGGLTQAAIETVGTWKLTPSIGPDGKPAAVRQIIEVRFQLH